jgi:hypothetical protein
LNGSPKPKASTSANILTALEERLAGNEVVRLRASIGSVPDAASHLLSCDALVIAFPLYVDSIPSHVIRFLEGLEQVCASAPVARIREVKLYAMINCGFMEPEHAAIAVDMVKFWCAKVGFTFGRAAAFGGGGMGLSVKIGYGPGKNYGLALDDLAGDIKAGRGGETIRTKMNFPRFLYIKAAHHGWRKAARKRGLKAGELYRRP